MYFVLPVVPDWFEHSAQDIANDTTGKDAEKLPT